MKIVKILYSKRSITSYTTLPPVWQFAEGKWQVRKNWCFLEANQWSRDFHIYLWAVQQELTISMQTNDSGKDSSLTLPSWGLRMCILNRFRGMDRWTKGYHVKRWPCVAFFNKKRFKWLMMCSINCFPRL